ncbi:MAG TPA: adenylate/guanylate cyclase domain-containing protein [Ktedonobacteraceae bacterium]|nr:adenylate/guanylate cyclase domain-containing protein [Ktedonobacteraceae bacterium]
MPEERKLVSILFADVSGSTALGESLDPEDVRTLMGRYYEHARRVVAEHGGTIEKFIGDAVMAVFGLTQAHEDDAERALAAALALSTAVANDEILGATFQLRMGVNTGEVVATSDLSTGDFLVTGDTVNVTARLQQHASPGEIIAGERTFNSAQSAFLFDEPGLISVKGKSQPLRAYPLKSVREARIVNRPPFVGRKQDLLQLALLEARVLEERRPQLVSIVAPAGTGKTRLLEEFLRRIDPEEGFQTAMVRCLPYGQTLTYWPLRGLLDGLMRGEEVAKLQIMAVFTQAGYQAEDASRLSDLILATLGIESDATGTTDRESIFAAWRLLIEAFAHQAPRILIFEDLHWASESMLDLVEHVTHQHTHAQVLLIVLSRPELLDRRPAWGGGRQNFTAIALQPLTSAQTHDLVEKLSANLPEATRQEIADRSGGNPFFALELVRGLAERGLSGEAATLDRLPDTVHAAVQARIDLLTRQERMVLQVASVASRAIRLHMLHAVLNEYSLQEIETALDGLLSRDMLVSSAGDVYAFRHILIRDVAYNTISRAQRVLLHSKIAAWLESTEADRLDAFAALIAYHYREAVLLARQSAIPKPLPHETERALFFLERAGTLAARSGAFVEAKDYLRNALALAPEAEHLRLYECLGDSLVWGDAVIEAYNSALERWRSEGEQDPLTGARLMRKLLSAYRRAEKYPKQEEIDAQWSLAQQLVEQVGDEAELWRFRITALVRYISGALRRGTIDEKEAREKLLICQEAAAFFEQREDWAMLNDALDAWITFLETIGAHVDALAVCRRRLTLPGLSTFERGDIASTMGGIYFLLGDYDRCFSTVQEALAALHPGEPIEYFAGAASIAMWVLYVSGQWDESSGLLKVIEQIWERLQLRPGAGSVVFDGYMAWLYMAKAREDRPVLDMATSVIEHMFAEDEGIKDFLAVIRDDDLDKLNVEGLATGVTGLILSLFSEANVVAPAKLMQTPVFQNDMSTHCLKIAQAILDNDNEQLAQAIDESEEHRLVVHAARMRVVLAQRTKDLSQLERARPVLERLGDRHFLRRLEEVEAVLKGVEQA